MMKSSQSAALQKNEPAFLKCDGFIFGNRTNQVILSKIAQMDETVYEYIFMAKTGSL